MHLHRKEDLSIYYFLVDKFSAFSFVNVSDGFPDAEMELPTISVEALDIGSPPFELGDRRGLRDRLWLIDVLALNKAQRDEFTYLILDSLENGIAVRDYDEGFPPDVPSPTQIGTLDVRDLSSSVVVIFPEIQEKLYWRMAINFATTFNQF